MSKIVYPACLYFTISIFICSGVSAAAAQANMAPNLSFMGMLLLFSVSLAALNRIFASRLNTVLKLAFHFAGTLTAFIIVFIVFSGYYQNSSSSVFIIILFMLAYALVLTTIMIVKSVVGREKNDSADYKNQFRS